MQSLFSFGNAAEVEIELVPGTEKKSIGNLQVYTATDTIAGILHVSGKKVEHVGIKIETVGVIELLHEKGHNFEFTALVRELAPPGTIETSQV